MAKKKSNKLEIKVPQVKKKFSSPEEVTAYYRIQGDRVKEALKDFKLKQTEIQLKLARDEYLKISSQKKDLDELKTDLISHKEDFERKIKELQERKDDESVRKKAIELFVKRMKSLENEAKKIMSTRESLIKHQDDLILKMKELAKQSTSKFKVADVPTAEDLLRFESSKAQVLSKAKEILSEEMKGMISDSPIFEEMDEKTVQKLKELNLKIIDVQNSKNDILKKMSLLDISEDRAESEMKRAEERVSRLEKQYEKLLKK